MAKEKIKAAEEKLASLEKLEGENKLLKKEVIELKKQQTEWMASLRLGRTPTSKRRRL